MLMIPFGFENIIW